MGKDKNIKATIIFLVILVIILLVLCILFATDTIRFKSNNIDNSVDESIINNDTNSDNDNNVGNNDNVDMSKHVELDEGLKINLKNVFKFVYDYYDSGNGYCGGYSLEDKIENVEGANYYTASNEYNSFDEMIKHLKEYMTEYVIYGKYSMSSDSYIEKDGKLYCPDYGKGGNIYHLDDVIIKYSIPYKSVIYTNIETKLSGYGDSINQLYDVTFEKKNDKWVISSYEKVES